MPIFRQLRTCPRLCQERLTGTFALQNGLFCGLTGGRSRGASRSGRPSPHSRRPRFLDSSRLQRYAQHCGQVLYAQAREARRRGKMARPFRAKCASPTQRHDPSSPAFAHSTPLRAGGTPTHRIWMATNFRRRGRCTSPQLKCCDAKDAVRREVSRAIAIHAGSLKNRRQAMPARHG